MPVQEGEHELLEEPVEERQEVSFRNQFLIFSVRDHIYISVRDHIYISVSKSKEAAGESVQSVLDLTQFVCSKKITFPLARLSLLN